MGLISKHFMLLKQNSERLVKNHAYAKKDLEIANFKLKKLMEQIQILEEKLQNGAKQKENEKILKGLEYKFSSAKTLCDKLTETSQQLTAQVQNAEKRKSLFEEKKTAVSFADDKLREARWLMSLGLYTSQETVKIREKPLMELGLEKERTGICLKDEQKRAASLIEEKENGAIKNLEESVAADKMAVEGLTSKMEESRLKTRVKEDALLDMRNWKETLEKEKADFISSQLCMDNRLEMALKEIKNIEYVVDVLILKFTAYEKMRLALSEKVIQLSTEFVDLCTKLAQQEKELYDKILELNKEQEFVIPTGMDCSKTPNWLDLPEGIFVLIVNKLHFADIIRVLAVCKTWQRSEAHVWCDDSLPWVISHQRVTTFNEDNGAHSFKCEFIDPYSGKVYKVSDSIHMQLTRMINTGQWRNALLGPHGNKVFLHASKCGWVLFGGDEYMDSVLFHPFLDLVFSVSTFVSGELAQATFKGSPDPARVHVPRDIFTLDIDEDGRLSLDITSTSESPLAGLYTGLAEYEDVLIHSVLYLEEYIYCHFSNGDLKRHRPSIWDENEPTGDENDPAWSMGVINFRVSEAL